jgi:hypothetical protein
LHYDAKKLISSHSCVEARRMLRCGWFWPSQRNGPGQLMRFGAPSQFWRK